VEWSEYLSHLRFDLHAIRSVGISVTRSIKKIQMRHLPAKLLSLISLSCIVRFACGLSFWNLRDKEHLRASFSYAPSSEQNCILNIYFIYGPICMRFEVLESA